MAIGTTAAILGSAAIGAGTSILGNRSNNQALNQANNATNAAANAATEEQRRQYDLSRGDNAPWLATGKSALSELANLYGLSTGNGANRSTYDFLRANPDAQTAIDNNYFGGPSDLNAATNFYQNQYGYRSNPATPGTTVTDKNELPQTFFGVGSSSSATTGAGNYGSFFASPDYQFRQNEQARALTARNAALGIQDSGAAQRSALEYSGNLASSEFNNYANRLASLAGVGQTAAGQNQALGTNYANAVGNIAQNNAQNLASSYQQRGANNANTYGQIAGIGSGLLQNFSRPSYGGVSSDLIGLF